MHLITFSGLRFALYGLNATSLSPLSPCAFSLTPLNPLILTAHVTQPASPRQPSIPPLHWSHRHYVVFFLWAIAYRLYHYPTPLIASWFRTSLYPLYIACDLLGKHASLKHPHSLVVTFPSLLLYS